MARVLGKDWMKIEGRNEVAPENWTGEKALN
jgi:hypothetical protein